MECGLKFKNTELFNTHLHQHAVEEEEMEEGQVENDARLNLSMSDDDEDDDDEDEEDDEENKDDEEDDDEDDEDDNIAMDADGAERDSWETSTMKLHTADTVSMNGNLRSPYTCLVCGKVYTYLMPFLKHQLQHRTNSLSGRSKKGGRPRRYECSICGMTFISTVRLKAHVKIHSLKGLIRPDVHQCDQCGKTLTSTRTWAAHMELHKQRLFWCLSCSKGFPDENALDKHLQGHSRRQHTCKICRKSFTKVSDLVAHYKNHSAAKVYQCDLCTKSFSFLGNLILHRQKHLGVFPGSDGRVTMSSSKMSFRKRKGRFPPSSKESQNAAEPPGAGTVDSEGSDCGEPTHQLRPDESELKNVPPTEGQELQEREAGGAHKHREHKYWEWDCCVCDMGFDEVEKLHLHYVKHATGELPIPQDYI